jgi:hypothetical protein
MRLIFIVLIGAVGAVLPASIRVDGNGSERKDTVVGRGTERKRNGVDGAATGVVAAIGKEPLSNLGRKVLETNATDGAGVNPVAVAVVVRKLAIAVGSGKQTETGAVGQFVNAAVIAVGLKQVANLVPLLAGERIAKVHKQVATGWQGGLHQTASVWYRAASYQATTRSAEDIR